MKNVFRNSFGLFLLFFGVTAGGIELNFHCYTVESGLSSNTVHSIIQDSRGFIWIGTTEGLNRFDGYEFRAYRHFPRDKSSIRNNFVYSLCEDSFGKLWVGTERGISIFDLQSEHFLLFDQKTEDGTEIRDKIYNILSDEQGQIWINSAREGVFVYHPERKTLKNYRIRDGLGAEYYTCIYRDRENTVWLSVNNTKYQIYRFNKDKDAFEAAFPTGQTEELKKLSSYAILEDAFGVMWFGSWQNGLFSADKKRGVMANYLNEPHNKAHQIHSVTEYATGRLLIGSNTGMNVFSISITGYDREALIVEPQLSSKFVYPVCKDREGGLWVGTYYGGVNYASPNRNYFTGYTYNKYENSIGGMVVSVFCEDGKGNLWIGMDDGGLNYFDTETRRFTVYKSEAGDNSLSTQNVHALCLDGDILWIGTYRGGLNAFNLKTERFKHYYTSATDTTTINDNSVYAICRDTAGNIWLGTMLGINLYNREKDCFSRVMETGEMITDILQVEDNIWFASISSGLYRYGLKTRQWKHYLFDIEDESSIICNDVPSLCKDGKNQLWIGTNNGLCRYEPRSDAFVSYSGIPSGNRSICKIFSDNSHLWMTTTKGLVYFNPETNESRVFSQSDGLLSDQFNLNAGIKTSKGEIYMGTARGFNAFFPKQIEINDYVPPVALTGFQLFNQAENINGYMDGKGQIILPYNKNSFGFEYTALSYYSPEKNKYAYKLEGFDRQWNNVDKVRTASYTNIPPGKYVFRIKASNNDGVWNETGIAVPLVVRSPFWWNTYAFLLYGLLSAGIVAFIIGYYRHRNEIMNSKKIEKVRDEQEKEAFRSKINFFTTVAHEIRTPVSLIIAPLEQIIKNSEILPKPVVEDLHIIDRNSNRLLTLVNEMLDFRKIEEDRINIRLSSQNVYEILLGIYERFKPSVEQRNKKIVFNADDENFVTRADVENLTKIVSNLLTNALKFTDDFIELKLITKHSSLHFEICVTDNGAGVPLSERENIFKPFYRLSENMQSGTGMGLYIVQSIVRACNGQIQINNGQQKGFSISVLLPLYAHNPNASSDGLSEEPVLQPQEFDMESDDFFLSDQKPTILVVEDNPDMQSFLQKTLTTCNVLLANDGVEGLKMMEKNEISLVISDIMMPNMDGIAFCKQIRANFLWSHLPVIILTAKTQVASKIEALNIGADAYVEKPFSVTYLQAQIENLLENRRKLLEKFVETPYVSLNSIAGNQADEDFLLKMTDIMEKNISRTDYSVEQLARDMNISSSGLFVKIKSLSGVSPKKLMMTIRLKHASERLLENKYRVGEICYMVGFNNPSYFAKCFQKQFGILPKDYAEKKMT